MKKIISTIKFIFNRKVFKVIGIGIAGIILFIVIFVISFDLSCRNALPNFRTVNDEIPSEFKVEEDKINNYSRAEESTYLTFPEWYLVFNPQEYGKFIGEEKPSSFPYFSSIGEFWSGYCQVYGITKRNYPFNGDVHLMEAVIGTSFSVEYALKGFWENTIGRVSEFVGGIQTEEDIFAANVAQEYGAFIPTDPWYQYPFSEKFKGLWKETSLFGPNVIRKWERKIFLTIEYGVKAIYASLIKYATHSIYGIADTEIYAAVKNAPKSIFDNPKVRMIKDLGNNSYIITVPHYQGFTDTVPGLARTGIQFIDIAGSDEILLTAIAPAGWEYDLKEGTLLFTMDMITSKSKRIAVQAPAKSLSNIIVELEDQGVIIEHLYDY